MASTTHGTVFLTGATGFIGSRSAQILCQQGWNIRALVRDSSKARRMVEEWSSQIPRRIEFVEGDLFAGSPADRMRLFGECLRGADVVLHAAEAKKKERDFDAKNIKTFGLLLEAAGKSESVKRIVFVSAFMAGGIPQPLPNVLSEEMTGDEFPDPYYQWKRMAERLLIRSSSHSHFSYSIIRPALVYGAHAEWLVPMLRIIHALGKYYIPLPEGGRALLGTVHREDVANTIASSCSSKHAENQIIHAVDNGGTTYIDWFETIARAAGWKVRLGTIPKSFIYGAARATDAATSLVGLHYGAYLWGQVLAEGCGYSNERMRQIIGNLKNPTIRQGVPEMMEWFQRTKS